MRCKGTLRGVRCKRKARPDGFCSTDCLCRDYSRWRQGLGKTKETTRKWRTALRLETLAHYGRGKRILCKWPGCVVCDPDMLTLDHIKDDGRAHRIELTGGRFGGPTFYSKLKKLNWPKGLQTLCWNHQMKKESLRRRRLGEEA